MWGKDCQNYSTGDHCEECQKGYTFSKIFGKCVQNGIHGYHINCSCHRLGSISEQCINQQCMCKRNVKGKQCDSCNLGAFGFSENSLTGCIDCFCSGVSNECFENDLYFHRHQFHIHKNEKLALSYLSFGHSNVHRTLAKNQHSGRWNTTADQYDDAESDDSEFGSGSSTCRSDFHKHQTIRSFTSYGMAPTGVEAKFQFHDNAHH
ncbi:hypothetical protein TKK_0016168 [Trichogramma kaykai]